MASPLRILVLDVILRWKRFVRTGGSSFHSAVRTSRLAVDLAVGANCLAAGMSLDWFIRWMFRVQDVVIFLEDHLLEGFLGLLVVRIVASELPHLDIQPFLVLPVRRMTLLGIYGIRILTKGINLVPLLLVLPFWWKVVLHTEQATAGVLWILGFICLHIVFVVFELILRLWIGEVRKVLFVACVLVLLGSVFGDTSYLATLSRATGRCFLLLRGDALFVLAAFILLVFAAGLISTRLLKVGMYIDLN